MRRQPERGQDARLVAGCLAGDYEALVRLAGLLAAALRTPVGRHLHRRLGCDEAVIEDAEQELWCRLLAAPAGVLGKFEPARAPLAGFLLALVRRQARSLNRGDRRRRARERAVSVPEAMGRAAEADWGGLARGVWACLTPRERAFMLGPQHGQPTGEFQGLSDAARWQLACRVRRKLQEYVATMADDEGGQEN